MTITIEAAVHQNIKSSIKPAEVVLKEQGIEAKKATVLAPFVSRIVQADASPRELIPLLTPLSERQEMKGQEAQNVINTFQTEARRLLSANTDPNIRDIGDVLRTMRLGSQRTSLEQMLSNYLKLVAPSIMGEENPNIIDRYKQFSAFQTRASAGIEIPPLQPTPQEIPNIARRIQNITSRHRDLGFTIIEIANNLPNGADKQALVTAMCDILRAQGQEIPPTLYPGTVIKLYNLYVEEGRKAKNVPIVKPTTVNNSQYVGSNPDLILLAQEASQKVEFTPVQLIEPFPLGSPKKNISVATHSVIIDRPPPRTRMKQTFTSVAQRFGLAQAEPPPPQSAIISDEYKASDIVDVVTLDKEGKRLAKIIADLRKSNSRIYVPRGSTTPLRDVLGSPYITPIERQNIDTAVITLMESAGMISPGGVVYRDEYERVRNRYIDTILQVPFSADFGYAVTSATKSEDQLTILDFQDMVGRQRDVNSPNRYKAVNPSIVNAIRERRCADLGVPINTAEHLIEKTANLSSVEATAYQTVRDLDSKIQQGSEKPDDYTATLHAIREAINQLYGSTLFSGRDLKEFLLVANPAASYYEKLSPRVQLYLEQYRRILYKQNAMDLSVPVDQYENVQRLLIKDKKLIEDETITSATIQLDVLMVDKKLSLTELIEGIAKGSYPNLVEEYRRLLLVSGRLKQGELIDNKTLAIRMQEYMNEKKEQNRRSAVALRPESPGDSNESLDNRRIEISRRLFSIENRDELINILPNNLNIDGRSLERHANKTQLLTTAEYTTRGNNRGKMEFLGEGSGFIAFKTTLQTSYGELPVVVKFGIVAINDYGGSAAIYQLSAAYRQQVLESQPEDPVLGTISGVPSLGINTANNLLMVIQPEVAGRKVGELSHSKRQEVRTNFRNVGTQFHTEIHRNKVKSKFVSPDRVDKYVMRPLDAEQADVQDNARFIVDGDPQDPNTKIRRTIVFDS